MNTEAKPSRDHPAYEHFARTLVALQGAADKAVDHEEAEDILESLDNNLPPKELLALKKALHRESKYYDIDDREYRFRIVGLLKVLDTEKGIAVQRSTLVREMALSLIRGNTEQTTEISDTLVQTALMPRSEVDERLVRFQEMLDEWRGFLPPQFIG